jgi:hypothetical protein
LINIFSPKTLIIFFTLISSVVASAAPIHYNLRGYLSARLSSYTNESSRNYGQLTRSQFEQSAQLSTNLVALNQLRMTSNTIASDLSKKSQVSKKDEFNIYLGENYLKYKSSNFVVQVGYQEVVWGEAFGFNYADIIGPRDQRETLYTEVSDARLPLLLFNGKTFFSSGDFTGSVQLLASPEPRFSKTLPVEIYAGKLIPQTTLNVEKEKTPNLFDTTEVGGKLAMSYAGMDISFFTYSYLARDPYYQLTSATATELNIKEVHSKVQSYGLSFAKTFFDFVFRTDIVQTKDRMVNFITPQGLLLAYPTVSLDTLISIDTPTYNGYSGVFIFAKSTIGDFQVNSFREKNEQYAIGKISKDLGADKSLEVSYTHEFLHPGHSIQTSFNWPINSTTDLKLGGQLYFGDELSNLNKFKKVSSVFFSIKNYFQF